MKTKTKHTPMKVILSIQEETISAMTEVARLFPGNDPTRLAAGVNDFKLPINQTLKILRSLAPHFQGENADMIRIAAGYRNLEEQVKKDRITQPPKVRSAVLKKIATKGRHHRARIARAILAKAKGESHA